MLRELAPDLWVTERPLRFLAFAMGTRMTVIRLPGGGLWLHSPVRIDPDLRKQLDDLGPVRFAVAPNRYHHLFVGDVAARWPHAELWAAPGLPERRRDVAFTGVLSDAPEPGWAGVIDQAFFGAMPLLNEVVFLHRPSRTLVMTDLAHDIGPETPLSGRLFAALFRTQPGFGPSRLERWFTRDRAAGRATMERILAWDFDRVIVAHGRVLESGGPALLRRGFAWLLDGRAA